MKVFVYDLTDCEIFQLGEYEVQDVQAVVALVKVHGIKIGEAWRKFSCAWMGSDGTLTVEVNCDE